MKTKIIALACATGAAVTCAYSEDPTYTNFIRQVQFPSGVQWDMSVASISPAGGSLSPLAINPGGARFELWTVKSTPLTNYLLDSKYVGTYVPLASVAIRSEDPYSDIPRTRADRPFWVDITVTGLLAGEDDPEPSKSVKLLRHVQSYGVGGTGLNVDRTQAILHTQSYIDTNGSRTLNYTLTSVPGANLAKLRGEERFSIFSLADYQAPESQLASKFIQIWPEADGSISGIAQNQVIRMELPQLTLTLNDGYPGCSVYAQAYEGNLANGVTGRVIPASAKSFAGETLPVDRTLVIRSEDYDSTLDNDGRWTIEFLTVTPFDVTRLAYVSFDLDRTIKMNASVTTIE